LSTGVLNGQIYAIGGDGEATLDLLDPVTQSWRTVALPTQNSDAASRSRYFGAAVTAWNRVFYIGGTVDWLQPQIDVYDPSTQLWLDASSPLAQYGRLARMAHAAVALDGEILVIGGLRDSGPDQQQATLDAVEAFHPGASTNTLDLYRRPSLPQPRAGLGAERIADQVYVVGGYLSMPATGSAEATGSMLRYHANAWHADTPGGEPLASLNVPRHSFGMTVLDGMLYVAGGVDSAGHELDSVEAYDPRTNTWTLQAPMFAPRAHLGLAAHAGRLYAIGGFDASGKALRSVHVFRP
jgi:hypothetical protein